MREFFGLLYLVLQVSEEAGTEQVNTPVDPDGEVQLFNEVQSLATQIEVKTFFISHLQTYYSLQRI